jgi:hypothetical protein
LLKKLALGTTVLLLGGCAVPVPFQIASWALDGISYLATQKSVADHGISIVADKDCAVWRGVTEGELCREGTDQDIMVADNSTGPVVKAGFSTAPEKPSLVQPLPAPRIVTNQQVVLERRMAGVKFGHAMSKVERPNETTAAPVGVLAVLPPANLTISEQPESIHPAVVKPVKLAEWSPPKKPEFLDREPISGIYYVIGSFRNQRNAMRLSSNHEDLSATMLTAKFDGKKLYRVVVGPVPKGKEKVTHKVLRRAGLVDTWAMRVNPADWTISQRISSSNDELAKLND